MSMAMRVTQFLREHDLPYDVLSHAHSQSSLQTAESAHVSGNCVAKSVVLEDDDGYLMAVIPASYRLDLKALDSYVQHHVHLVDERELASLFDDCELGAVPAVGPAYGLRTLVDEHIAEQPDIYFDAGDHEQLVHMTADDFFELMENVEFGEFSQPM